MIRIVLALFLGFCALGPASADLWKTSFEDVKDARAMGLEFLSGQWQLRQASNPNKTVNQFLSQTGHSGSNAARGNTEFSLAMLQHYADFPAGIFYARVRLWGAGNLNGGLVLRYLGPSDFFYVGFSKAENKVALYHVRGKNAEKLTEAKIGVEANKWLGLRLFMRQGRLKVEVDGQLALQFNDPLLDRGGGLGFCTQGKTQADFDNVIVAPLNLP